MLDEEGLQIFGGESIIKRLNQSSGQGSTITLAITDELYTELRGHEGKIGSLFWRETGNDGEPTVTKPFKPQKLEATTKSERWEELGGRTKWLIDRCKDPEFQKFCGAYKGVMSNAERENAAKQYVMQLFEFEKSRKEVEHFKHHREFDMLRSDFAKYLECN